MRIRSIKPEFWRSDDISALPWETRLLFIGLWSYVDDNGVGRDDERIIRAELFALDEDLTESSLRVHAGLKLLHTRRLIDRYTVDGKPYLHIRTWSRHQKINRPSPGRYPLPTSDDASFQEPLTEDSLSNQRPPSPGAGEQGSSGSGEQEKKRAPAEPDATKPASVEQVITSNAYERVGKAFKFVAVRSIAKWAIHDRGADPKAVEDAIVGIYEMGKPHTKTVMGQYLDGHFRSPGNGNGLSRADQKVQNYLNYGRPAAEQRELG